MDTPNFEVFQEDDDFTAQGSILKRGDNYHVSRRVEYAKC